MWNPEPPANPFETAYLSVRLVKRGPPCAARVVHEGGWWTSWLNGEQHGQPVQDEMAAGGFIQGWFSVKRITVQEHDFLLARHLYARHHEPDSPFANPHKPISLRLLKPLGA